MSEPLPAWNSHDAESLRAFAAVRLLVADIDGTLISRSIAQVFQRIDDLRRLLIHRRYGVQMTIATGRAYKGVGAVLARLRLDPGTPLVLYNGSLVLRYRTNDILLHRTVSPDAAEQVRRVARECAVICLAYYVQKAQAISSPVEEVRAWGGELRPMQDFNGIPITWDADLPSDVGPTAILVEGTEGGRPLNQVAERLRTIPGIEVTTSGHRFLELRPEASNKASALASLTGPLSIPREAILALGDSDNDAEMLAWAGVGVAIADASPKAREAARYYCRHGAAEGAIEVLRIIREAKRYYSATPKAS